jgi:TolA-binding protein
MIAESYLRIGRVEEAKKSYAKFVDEYPNSNQIPRAKKMLQQL